MIVQQSRRGVEYVLANGPVLSGYYWQLSPKFYKWYLSRKINSSVPINPIKVVYFPTKKINKMTGRKYPTMDRWKDVGKVQPGDWDITQRSEIESGRAEIIEQISFGDYIDETVLYYSFENHFINQVPWEETEFVKKAIDAVENGTPCWHNCQSKEDILNRCIQMDKLYKNIKSNGYKTQLEMCENKNSNFVSFLDLITDEITVDINRDGEPLFVDGRHRLSIAKLLGIPKVPTTILVRHPKWINKREYLFQRHVKNVKENEIHPDLQEVLGV